MAAGSALILLMALVASAVAAFGFGGLLSEVAFRHLEAAPGHALRNVDTAVSSLPVLRELKRKTLDKKRSRELRACMPEALRLLSMSLESGSSLNQALDYAARHCAQPLAGELKRAVWDLEAGQSFSEAMASLRQRTGGSEFSYLAVAMELQHISGGSMGPTIAAVSDSLQQTAQLEEELQTKTTQGRLSARIVALMPVILLCILSLFTDNYLEQFFSSSFGVFMFVFALLLEALGVVLVKRTLAVDLSSGLGGRT